MASRSEGETYWTTEEVAAFLGVRYVSVRNYHQRATRERRRGELRQGQFPPPDHDFSGRPVWRPETIKAWLRDRPGQGRAGWRQRIEK